MPGDKQQALRRRRRRERQAVVFGSLVAGLAIAGLGAAAVYTEVLEVPFISKDFSSPPPEAVDAPPPVPCPAPEATPVPFDQIQVAVLNGTDRRGLAGGTADTLAARGFAIARTGNAVVPFVGTAQLSFGQQGVAAAYTLAAHLPDPVLRIDLREDASVDLILGEAWTAPLDAGAVALDPAVPLVGMAGCVPLEQAVLDADPAPVAPAQPAEGEAVEGETVEGEQPAAPAPEG